MNLNKPAVIKKLQERFRNVNAGRGLYTAFLVPTMLTMFSTRAFAADTIWTKASAIMQDVYTQILGISTIAAVVTAAIALLLMNFSRSGRTVDESRAWLKRIIITWAILNSLGFNQAFLTRPLRYAIMDYLKENPMERFGSCAICIVHNYDAALGKRRIRDYDNIETKRYLDVIESMLLTNDSGLLCTVLQATRMSDRDSAEFYLMRPETLSSWAKNHIKTTTKTCSE